MSIKSGLQTFKQHLAEVFDDNLHTKRWHNIADWCIIGMILISTAEIFLSTFDLNPALRRVLIWVDIITLAFFTVEVSLRIWVAPMVNPKYKGWKGRLKYCFSFHGFVDVISTYPFYLQWLIPFPIAWLKVLRMSRTVRLFRVSRYMKSWRLLTSAIQEKRRELLISMQFLLIVTFILSLMLFFTEHEAQPENYDNGFASVLWAFAQYIGDPGNFGDNAPITVFGKIIACVVGLLGIAIVAVPAGILGSGFTEAIEKENAKEELEENREKLRKAFERKLDRPTGYQVVKPYLSIPDIQTRMEMSQGEIVDAVNDTRGFRLINLASTIPTDKNPQDRLAVEHFAFNRPYGLMIDRGSCVTIVAPASFVDACTSFFAYYIAMIGGFNLISREFGCRAPYRSYYVVQDGEKEEGEAEYFADIERLANREGAWIVTSLVASGANEPEYPEQIHIGTGAPKRATSLGDFIRDKAAFSKFFADLSSQLTEEFGIQAECDQRHTTASQKNYMRHISLPADAQGFVIRTAWSAMLWDSRRILLAQTIADFINRDLLGLSGNPENPELGEKEMGY